MRRLLLTVIAVLLLLAAAPTARANPMYIELFEFALNIDGTIYDVGGANPYDWSILPASVDLSGFDTTSGIGTIGVTMTGPGVHSFLAFYDHEIQSKDDAGNIIDGFTDENGVESGAAPAGLSWEIDEPGYTFGDIYTNFSSNSLDNMAFGGVPTTDDVSMAIGWESFSLNPGDTATITLKTTLLQPSGGFYLRQWDSTTGGEVPNELFLGGNLNTGNVVPEPAQLIPLAVMLGSLSLVLLRNRRRASK